MLAAGGAQVGERLEAPTVADRHQDVVKLAVLWARVVDVVRDNHREAQLGGQARGLRHEPVVVGEEMMGQLDHEASAGDRLAGTAEPARICLLYTSTSPRDR